MIEINGATASRLLLEAVADRGENYVYREVDNGAGGSECVYVHGTEMVRVELAHDEEQVTGHLAPGCIVGHCLISAGIDPLKFIELNINRRCGAFDAATGLQAAGVATFAPHALELFALAQSHQDFGKTWGESVELALDGGYITYGYDD